MNKEQLLGRLLMNGHINIDELNILIKEKDVNKYEAEIDPYTTTTKNIQCTTTGVLFDWANTVDMRTPAFKNK